MQKILRVAAWALVLLACRVAAQPIEPVVPVLRSVEDLPERAKLVASARDDTERKPQPFDEAPEGTAVFVVQRADNMAAIWAPDGRFGYVETGRLFDIEPPTATEYRALVSALENPASARKLGLSMAHLLQATYAKAMLDAAPDRFVAESLGRVSARRETVRKERRREEVTADQAAHDLALIRTLEERKFVALYPVLIRRWLNTVEPSFYADDEEIDPLTEANRSPLHSTVFANLHTVLATPKVLGDVLCGRFGVYLRQSRDAYGFNARTEAGDILMLLLIRALYPDHAPPCLLSGLKQIAARNADTQYPGRLESEVDLVMDLLRHYLGQDAYEKWLLTLSKETQETAAPNLALVLLKWPQIRQPALIDWLYARLRDPEVHHEGKVVQRRSLAALEARGPSRRLRAALLKLLAEPYLAPEVRLDTLLLLGDQAPSSEVAGVLAGVLSLPQRPGDDPRATQVAAERLAGEAWRGLAATAWKKALDHADPYVRHLALGVSRDEALAAIKAATTQEARDRARGAYLDAVRARVEALRLGGAGLDLRPSPRWMVKPSATVAVRLRQVWNPERFVPRLVFEAPPAGDFVARQGRDQPPPAERQPAMVEPLMLHPGRVALRTTGSGAQTQLHVQVALDELVVDGRPVVDAARPGIYTLTMFEGDAVLFRTAWYSEPDNAFWRDAGLEPAME